MGDLKPAVPAAGHGKPDVAFAVWEGEGGVLDPCASGDAGRDLVMLGAMLAIFGDLPARTRLALYADLLRLPPEKAA